jgi:hypothetical protein
VQSNFTSSAAFDVSESHVEEHLWYHKQKSHFIWCTKRSCHLIRGVKCASEKKGDGRHEEDNSKDYESVKD